MNTTKFGLFGVGLDTDWRYATDDAMSCVGTTKEK